MGLENVGERVRTAAAGILRHADFGLGHAPSHFPSKGCVGQVSRAHLPVGPEPITAATTYRFSAGPTNLALNPIARDSDH